MDPTRFAGLLPARTASPEATEALGRALAARLRPGDVVALHGDLGAGKTALVRGIAAGLGADPGAVASPTFTIAHAYAAPGLTVHHLDLYRLTSPEAVREIGGDDYFDPERAVTLVEWPERAGPLLPPGALHLRLAHAGGDARDVDEGGAPSVDGGA